MWSKVIISIIEVGFNDDSCCFIINLIVKKS